MFTDSSLATAFVKSGFDITAAWYFGMDIYELIFQWTLCNNDKELIQNIKHYIPRLQDTIDRSRLSDSMVLVGVPSKI